MIVLLLALPGCGEADEARHTAEAFYTAVERGDGAAACALLTKPLGCAGALTVVGPRDPRADEVDLMGGTAKVRVHGADGAVADVELVKAEGSWKLRRLPSPPHS